MKGSYLTVTFFFITIPYLQVFALDGNDTVKTLQFVVKTSNQKFSETENNVWFDLGPKAWKYTLGFKRGETKIINVNPYNIDKDVSLDQQDVPLLVKDISEFRIEKKGMTIPFFKKIGGLTNGPDNFWELLFPNLYHNNRPHKNEWLPESVTILINNEKFAVFYINTRLKKSQPSCIMYISKNSDEDNFVKGLRVNKNSSGGWIDEKISGITTPLFKDRGISGWEDGPVRFARIKGTLVNRPSPGWDRFVSLDIKIDTVIVNNKEYILDNMHNINHVRYVRVEHVKRRNRKRDRRYKKWVIGSKIEVFGEVKRDTDRITFFEIHTSSFSDIRQLTDSLNRSQ